MGLKQIWEEFRDNTLLIADPDIDPRQLCHHQGTFVAGMAAALNETAKATMACSDVTAWAELDTSMRDLVFEMRNFAFKFEHHDPSTGDMPL